MILILNQHKGSIDELIDHIKNFGEVSDKEWFWMSMIVDQPMTLSDRMKILSVSDKYDNILLSFNERNVGLGPSRVLALQQAMDCFDHKRLKKDCKGILFGCTNSKYLIKLDERIHDKLAVHDRPILLPCKCKNDFMERSKKFHHIRYITPSAYINESNKPDYSILLPYEFRKNIQCIAGETYYPEELMMNLLSIPYLEILDETIIESWYNEKGLSKSFDRKFMLTNRMGFYLRSSMLLNGYRDEKIYLSLDKLKSYMYDYVTLTEASTPKDLKHPILEAVYWWVLQHWVDCGDAKHRITFREDTTYNPN